MLVLLVNQRSISVFDNSINLDLAGNHLRWLQRAVVQGLDDTCKIRLEITKNYCDD